MDQCIPVKDSQRTTQRRTTGKSAEPGAQAQKDTCPPNQQQ
jgi:hypothetical protein